MDTNAEKIRHTSMEFVRYPAEICVVFPAGHICCEWCNLSQRNRKGHIQCPITQEEMVSPADSIGIYCPARKEIFGGIGNE